MNVELVLMSATMNLFVSTQKDRIDASVRMNSLVTAHFVKVCRFIFLIQSYLLDNATTCENRSLIRKDMSYPHGNVF